MFSTSGAHNRNDFYWELINFKQTHRSLYHGVNNVGTAFCPIFGGVLLNFWRLAWICDWMGKSLHLYTHISKQWTFRWQRRERAAHMMHSLSGFPVVISCNVVGWCGTHAYPWGNHGIWGHAFARLVVFVVFYGIRSRLHTPTATTFFLIKKKTKKIIFVFQCWQHERAGSKTSNPG